jgi:acyl dehydratase
MNAPRWAYEDLQVGVEIALGPRLLDAAEIVEFAAEYDPQPFHLDEEAGRASILGGLSASGWQSCAIFMRMMCDAFLLDSTSEGAGGIEFANWKRPLLAGDTLQGASRVEARRLSRSRPQLGLVTFRHHLSNQHGAVVLEVGNTGMFRTRSAA